MAIRKKTTPLFRDSTVRRIMRIAIRQQRLLLSNKPEILHGDQLEGGRSKPIPPVGLHIKGRRTDFC